MTSDRSDKRSHRIPIRFTDADDESRSADATPDEMDRLDPDNEGDEFSSELNEADHFSGADVELEGGGPERAELIATRAELKRVEAENAELKDHREAIRWQQTVPASSFGFSGDLLPSLPSKASGELMASLGESIPASYRVAFSAAGHLIIDGLNRQGG